MTPEGKKDFDRLVTEAILATMKTSEVDGHILIDCLTEIREFHRAAFMLSMVVIENAGYKIDKVPDNDDPFVINFDDLCALVKSALHMGIQVGVEVREKGGKLPEPEARVPETS